MLKQFSRRVWEHFFPPSLIMNCNPRYAEFQIGDWTYGNPEILRWQESTILKIGKFCAIADGVQILLGGEHHTEWVTGYPFWPFFKDVQRPAGHPRSKGDVIIGNDVWIGREAMILSGVTIGDGAVIAARSIVSKNVPPYSVVGGNPMRIIRARFADSIVKELLAIAWWNWPEDRLRKNLGDLHSDNIEEFIRKFKALSQ